MIIFCSTGGAVEQNWLKLKPLLNDKTVKEIKMFAIPKAMSSGKTKWYLRYRNEKGRLLYYPKDKYPDFWSKKEANEWIKKNRENLTHIKKQADVLRQIQAKYKYPDFQILIDKLISVQKREAPNSWESSVLYMDRFIVGFFLNIKGLPNINEWYLYFEEFRDYLEKKATVMGKDKLLEYSSKNHAIRTLNKFLTIMARYNYLKIPNPPKCRPFPKHKLNTRGYKDVIKPDEYFRIRDQLDYSKSFFSLLYHTGMRFNELYSLHIDSVYFKDEISDHLMERFKNYNVEIFGYLLLEDQIDGKTKNEAKRKASKDKKCETLFKRKPLKSCKKIEAKNRRTIPIFSKEAWDIIVKNYDRGWDEYENREINSDDPKDYFLLDVEVNQLRRELKTITSKGYHALRHTYITHLVGQYRDMALTRIITGHKSDAFESYVHIYERIAEEGSKKRKSRRRRGLKKVS